MPHYISKVAITAAALIAMASPALADTSKLPPGSPCGGGPGQGSGNPCNGNNGNPGPQGNVWRDMNPAPISIAMPAVSGRAAFIDQIGTANEASVGQSASDAYARIRQQGERNSFSISQSGSASSYFDGAQTGNANTMHASQGGNGSNVLSGVQWGDANAISVRQSSTVAAGLHNGAQLAQNGSRNSMDLSQDGNGNVALLTQNGNDNQMSLVQLGDGNQLTWTQQGNGLSNLSITQDGSGPQSTMSITQTRN